MFSGFEKCVVVALCGAGCVPLAGCGGSPVVSGAAPAQLGQMVHVGCTDKGCSSDFTVEKLTVGGSCRDFGVEEKYGGVGEGRNRGGLFLMINANIATKDAGVAPELRFEAVTTSGVVSVLSDRVDCAWLSPINEPLSELVDVGGVRAWDQVFMVPEDIDRLQVVDVSSGYKFDYMVG